MSLQEDFRESATYELLEPYLDGHGLLAGYHIEGLVTQDAWRHSTYEAVTRDGSRVGLKLLGVRSDQTRGFTRRLHRQLRLRASIEHPHLLPILDWGEVGDRLYVAMPFSRAATLADLLAAAPLRPNGALRLLSQVADGLEEAHARGLVHRNLEPDRVLVEPRDGGHVLLGDFGVGDPEWNTGLLDQPESTPYLSPEKVRGEPLIAESNVYSLACILVECLAGHPPYQSEHAGVVAYAHVAEPPPRLAEERPEYGESLDELLAVAMAKDPAERLSSPRQLVELASAALGVSRGTDAPPNGAAALQSPRTREATASASGYVPLPLEPSGRSDGPAAGIHKALLAAGLTVTIGFGALGFVVGRSGANGTEPPRSSEPAATPATGEALESLDARRVVLRRRLAAARSPAAQTTAAGQLATAYANTARRLPTSAPDAVRLGPAVTAANRAYQELAEAARAADRARYAAAARAVERSERAVGQAIRRMGPR